MTLPLTWLGEHLTLLPQRALFWRRASTLFVADMHLGKAAAFRAAGVPVPEAVTGADLARLATALDETGAERLVILGDLLHARAGRAEAVHNALRRWRRARDQLDILLVRGNHDHAAGDPPASWRIRCEHGPVVEPPFAFLHEPAACAHGYALAGHVHPVVVLRGQGGRLRAPCFAFGRRFGLLPAFGAFTGGARVAPRGGDRVFAIGPGVVVEATVDPATPIVQSRIRRRADANARRGQP